MRSALSQYDEVFVLTTPVGKLAVFVYEESLTQVDYGSSIRDSKQPLSPTAKKIKTQIECYFKTPDRKFDLPVSLDGTDFQIRVWRALQTIPVGKTMTYGQLAKKLKSSARAVGNACRNNPVPLVVPCHRVVAQKGIGGFGGKTEGINISRKRWLLDHEGVSIL